jgi:hypothetical protein
VVSGASATRIFRSRDGVSLAPHLTLGDALRDVMPPDVRHQAGHESQAQWTAVGCGVGRSHQLKPQTTENALKHDASMADGTQISFCIHSTSHLR